MISSDEAGVFSGAGAAPGLAGSGPGDGLAVVVEGACDWVGAALVAEAAGVGGSHAAQASERARRGRERGIG